jgi:hypothetical protein
MEKRILWHNDPEKGWVQVELHATDAVHALNVDPANWSTEKPMLAPEPMPEPEETKLAGEDEHPGDQS